MHQPKSVIYRLPPEVLSNIVSLSYRDGNAAIIHTLCLVSKYLLAIADPFKFRFVAISGITQLTSLLRVLRRNPVRAKQIISLFLAESPPWHQRREPRGFRRWFSIRYLLSKRPDFVEGVTRLISKVRPTLQALTCVVDNWFPEDYGPILSLPFPSLTRLHLRVTWFRYDRNSRFDPSLPAYFPALRFLHISTQHYLYDQNLSHLASLCAHAPQLDTLKLSGAWPDPDHFEVMWKQQCVVEPKPDNVVPITPPLDNTVRRILVQNYNTDSEALGFLAEQGQLIPRDPVSRVDIQEGLIWLSAVNPPNERERLNSAFEELHRERLAGMGHIDTHSVQRVYPQSAFSFLHVPIALTVGIYT
jgi:hypothetical protein